MATRTGRLVGVAWLLKRRGIENNGDILERRIGRRLNCAVHWAQTKARSSMVWVSATVISAQFIRSSHNARDNVAPSTIELLTFDFLFHCTSVSHSSPPSIPTFSLYSRGCHGRLSVATMGRSSPPFLYDRPSSHSFYGPTERPFNPRAVTQASRTRSPPKAQPKGPLLDVNVNRHPDSV